MNCDCYFCLAGLGHPKRHSEFHRLSDRLLVAESLDPKDRIQVHACTTCGHKIEGEMSDDHNTSAID